MESLGVRVPRNEAEATRRRLLELDLLRIDLAVSRDGDDVIFPVVDSCGPRLSTMRWDFSPRKVRPAGYQDLLPEPLRASAPRAFDQLGDIAIVKVPDALWPQRAAIGEALQRFVQARAVFHDHGVQDPYRVRALERIAGEGDSLTRVQENGIALWVDPSRAYYSPRLASERARIASQVQPDEHVVDLFGGVAPLGIQAARRGAQVDSIDINPDAVALAGRNVRENSAEGRVRIHGGDAREVAPSLALANRVVMNLPHGAAAFLDVAVRLASARATIHYHEILRTERVEVREEEVVEAVRCLGRRARIKGVRKVRDYSPEEAHYSFDVELL